MTEQQSTADVLMIRPANFAANPQTAATNRFQETAAAGIGVTQSMAAAEFDGLVAALKAAGVRVHVAQDTAAPVKPDAIFPNNWFSTHADGTLVLYPMLAENRRLERRWDLIQTLSTREGFKISRTVDLTSHEAQGEFLEGTGSLVLDRVNRFAYASMSPRTDLNVLGEFAQQLDYELVTFEAVDRGGTPLYHTNVLMCIGTKFAVICSAAIREAERSGVLGALQSTGHEIVDLTHAQLAGFAGNMLELRDDRGNPLTALSTSAFNALEPQQRAALIRLGGPLISAPIPTIEKFGGGSVRCMLAEIHLPRR